jgi:hypothetical protein
MPADSVHARDLSRIAPGPGTVRAALARPWSSRDAVSAVLALDRGARAGRRPGAARRALRAVAVVGAHRGGRLADRAGAGGPGPARSSRLGARGLARGIVAADRRRFAAAALGDQLGSELASRGLDRDVAQELQELGGARGGRRRWRAGEPDQLGPAPWTSPHVLEAGERALVAVVASPAQRGGRARTGPARRRWACGRPRPGPARWAARRSRRWWR